YSRCQKVPCRRRIRPTSFALQDFQEWMIEANAARGTNGEPRAHGSACRTTPTADTVYRRKGSKRQRQCRDRFQYDWGKDFGDVFSRPDSALGLSGWRCRRYFFVQIQSLQEARSAGNPTSEK